MGQRRNRKVRVDIDESSVISRNALVPEHNRRNKTSGTPLIRADVEEGTASGFGPLKLLLGAISAAYANREVSPRLPI